MNDDDNELCRLRCKEVMPVSITEIFNRILHCSLMVGTSHGGSKWSNRNRRCGYWLKSATGMSDSVRRLTGSLQTRSAASESSSPPQPVERRRQTLFTIHDEQTVAPVVNQRPVHACLQVNQREKQPPNV